MTYEIRVFFEGAKKEVFSSIFKKAQKNVKYAYVWIELRVCHYYVCRSHGLPNNMEYLLLNPSILSIVVVLKNSKPNIWIGRSLSIPMGWTRHWLTIFTWKGEGYIPCNLNHIQRKSKIMLTPKPPSIRVFVTLWHATSIVQEFIF